MQYFRPRNWEKFQGYKKRGPSWIKLHTQLLQDYDFHCLSERQQLALIWLWLHYAQHGRPLPTPPEHLGRTTKAARRHLAHIFKVAPQHVGRIFDALLSNHFIELVSESVADSAIPVAEVSQISRPETETETETKRIYVYEGTVIRLNEEDYNRWRERFSEIPDFDAALGTVDDALRGEAGSDPPKGWFGAAAHKLAYQHEKHKKAKAEMNIPKSLDRRGNGQKSREPTNTEVNVGAVAAALARRRENRDQSGPVVVGLSAQKTEQG